MSKYSLVGTQIHGRVVVVELVEFDTDNVFMFGLVPIPP